MLVDARDRFLDRMATVVLDATVKYGKASGNARIVHLSLEDKTDLARKIYEQSRRGKG